MKLRIKSKTPETDQLEQVVKDVLVQQVNKANDKIIGAAENLNKQLDGGGQKSNLKRARLNRLFDDALKAIDQEMQK